MTAFAADHRHSRERKIYQMPLTGSMTKGDMVTYRTTRRSSSPKLQRLAQAGGPVSFYRKRPARADSLVNDAAQSDEVLELDDIQLPNLMDTPEESDVYDDEPEPKVDLLRRPTEILLQLPPAFGFTDK